MTYEYGHNYLPGSTLYFVSFNAAGNAILADGQSAEVWGTGGRTAVNYAVSMEEIGTSGHYVGNSNVTTGDMVVQRVCIYVQSGATPANADIPVGQGVRQVIPFMQWSVLVTDRG